MQNKNVFGNEFLISESESFNLGEKEEIPVETQLLIDKLVLEFQLYKSPINFLRIDPKTGKQVDVALENTHPLYPITKLLHVCKHVPNFADLAITHDLITQSYIDSKNAIQKDKQSFGPRNHLECEPVHQSLSFIQMMLHQQLCTQEYELVLMSSSLCLFQYIADNQIVLFLNEFGLWFAIKGEQAYHPLNNLLPEHSEILKTRLSSLPKGSQQLIYKEDPIRSPIIEIVISRVDKIRKKNDLVLSLAEINLDIVKHCRKKSIEQQRKFKASITIQFESWISDASILLIKAHFLAGNYEICESYCRDLLDFIAKIKLKDVQDIWMRRFVAKYYLSMVYINFGYLEIAEQTVQELADILNKPFYVEKYDDLVENFCNICEALMITYQQKNAYLSVLKTRSIARSFFHHSIKNKKQVIKDHFPYSEASVAIKSRYQNLQRFYEPAKTKYTEELLVETKGFSSEIEKFMPNFDLGTLNIVCKDASLLPHLSKALAKLHLSVQKNFAEKSLTVDMYQCKPKLLKRAWEIGFTLAEKAKKEVLRVKEAQERLENQPTVSLSSSVEKVFSSPIDQSQLKLSISPPSQSENKKRDYKEKSNLKVNPTKSREVKNEVKEVLKKKGTEVIKQYHWPKAQVVYYSTDHQNGQVKSLHHDSIPEGLDVWFGYIPDWITNVPGYNPRILKLFNLKLEMGLLSSDGVRDIKKELNGFNRIYYKNFGYKFKIVLGRQDHRLYGWIDDVIVDADGRKRYLICFGYIRLHGDNRNLPNPEAWKKKMTQHIHNTDQELQQATNITTTTIDNSSNTNMNFRPGGC